MIKRNYYYVLLLNEAMAYHCSEICCYCFLIFQDFYFVMYNHVSQIVVWPAILIAI